jgi:glycosyltransferase involved in cell wall biosynthesis
VSYVDNLKRALPAYGAEARVLASNTATGGEDAIVIRGRFERLNPATKVLAKVSWKALPGSAHQLISTLDTIAAFRALKRDFPFEIAEMEETNGVARWVARSFREPLVVRLHGPWFLNGKAFGVPEDAEFHARVRREGVAIAEAAGVTAPSRNVLDEVRARYGIDLPNAVVIPNSGPEHDESRTWRAEGSHPGLVLFIGRFDRHKGGDLMVDAFVKLASTRPGLRLEMAGRETGFLDDAGKNWTFAEYVEAKVPAALRPSISLLGQVSPDQLVAARKRASVVVCPSRYENFAVALLETLAQGCPIVSSDAGGSPEIAQHEQSALIFPSGNVGALADAVARLLDDPELAQRLGAQALTDYRAKFLPSDVARATLDFYTNVLDRAKQRN